MVDLTDTNDNPPFFKRHEFTIDRLPEGNYTNYKLQLALRDQVIDKDTTEEYKAFRFSIVKGDPGNRFKIDPKTGQMSVNSSLDYETDPLHVLTVRVTNEGEHINNAERARFMRDVRTAKVARYSFKSKYKRSWCTADMESKI